MKGKAAREEGNPWARVEMPRGCAQHSLAAMDMGVKHHVPPHAAGHRQHLFHVRHQHHLNGPVIAEDPPRRWCERVCAPSPAAAYGLQSFPPDPCLPPGPAATSQLPAQDWAHRQATPHAIAPPATCAHPLSSPVGLGIKTQVKTQPHRDSQAFPQAGQPPKFR